MTASSSSSSLFSAGQFTDDGSSEPADPFGIDLAADIASVVGFYDTTVAQRRMSPSRSATAAS